MFPLIRATVFCLLAAAVRAEPTFEEVNTALGVPLFADDNLWENSADDVAKRLKMPQESQTSDQSSFRLYPGEEARVLGARPYSESLLAEEEKPTGLSLVFANKGDSVDYVTGRQGNREASARRGELRSNRKAIEEDAKTLEDALTQLFGEPSNAQMGGSRETREKVLRWDWKGHAFLLAAPREEYVALRILPSATVDSEGKARISDSAMRERLAARVERRPNGDVILRDMPMVNQGPKGYCVPATWERVMRYMGIPADMYVLAMAGGTAAGGGTSTNDLSWAVRSSVVSAGRRMESPAVKLTPDGVSKFTDAGLPIMWALFSTREFNAAADERARARKDMTDPKAWGNSLAEARKAARKMRKEKETGHVCMIIGYNKQTGELAISDSWGPAFTERWVTPEEAQAVSQNRFDVIRP